MRASGECEPGGVTPGDKCISDNDCLGYCTGDGTTPCAQDSPDCDGNGTCVGENCVAPCPEGSNPQGFGTSCEPNCCDQPVYSGADMCSEAEIVVINVPPLGNPPVTYTFRGDNTNAKFGDFIPVDAGGPGTCNWGVLNPDGATRDRGWWHAFSIDDCADVRLDLCCTEAVSGEVHQPQWSVLFLDCNPCTANIGNNVTGPGSYPPVPIGSATAANDRGLPFCPDADDLWQTFRHLPKGIYWHPIYTAPGGHFGEYQLHITVGACAEAACCLPDAVCLGGPLNGASCEINDDCAPAKADKICVGDTNRPNELCCPGGACNNNATNPVCVGGSRDTLACCDGGGICKGNCVTGCEALRQPDCDAVGGYWMGFGNIPLDDAPIVQCDVGVCQEYGSCCLGPGDCQDWSNPSCDPDDPATQANCCQPDGSNCMDKKLCDTLGGSFVAEALCDFPLDPCPACEIQGNTNCQLCDDGGDFVLYMSDLTVPPGGVVHADDFVPEGSQIDTLCVWGTYLDPANIGAFNYSCTGLVRDKFRVRIYEDNGFGLPGNMVGEEWVIDTDDNPVPRSSVPDCPGWIAVYETNLPLDVHTLSFPAITVTPGEVHWLEVANLTDTLAGGTDPSANTCYWHWMQVLFTAPDPATPEHGNRVSAVGSDDRCDGGYYDNFSCTTASDCPGGTCKAGYNGGYIDGSERWGGMAFCMGSGGAGANFLPGPVVRGACCSCEGVCTEDQSQFQCVADGAGGGLQFKWFPNQTCAEVGNCADLYEPGDDCGGVAAVGTVASVAGPDCTPPQPEPGACVPIKDGLYAIDTACANTDGAPSPTGQNNNQLGEDVWYCYTTTCTGSMVLSMCNTGNYFEAIDSYLAVHHDPDNPTECPCPGATTQFQVAESDEGCNGIADGGAGTYGPVIVFPGECWLIRAGGWGGTAAATDHGRAMIAAGCQGVDCFPAATPVLEMINKDPLPLPGHPYDGGINRKNRYISVSLTDARTQAIRVVMGPGPGPRKPGTMPPPFDIWAGQEFYAGAPRPYCENAGQGPSVRPDAGTGCGPAPGVYKNGQRWFWGAPLVCDKGSIHWMDWTTLANYCNTPGVPAYDGHPCTSSADCGTGTCGVSPVVHLFHEAIVPSHMAAGAGPIDHAAVYAVSAIDSSCALNIESNYSAPVQLHQAGWGDVVQSVANCPNWPPEQSVGVVTDVVALLNKFSNAACAVQKTRADLVPCRVDFNISITDVVAALAAFGGGDYENTCGTGQCVNNQCRGGADHGSPCTDDIDCNSEVCTGKLEVAGK